MLRMIETHFTSAGKLELGDGTPSCFLYLGAPDALLLQRGYLRFQIITHEIELVTLIRFVGMNRGFRRRQREDEPSVAGVHRWKS